VEQHLDVAPLLQGEHEAAIADDGPVGETLEESLGPRLRGGTGRRPRIAGTG
jgi:hypothetical protein